MISTLFVFDVEVESHIQLLRTKSSKYSVLYNSVSSDPTDLQVMPLSLRNDILTTSESTDRSIPMAFLCQI